jgi:hypothetical protein
MSGAVAAVVVVTVVAAIVWLVWSPLRPGASARALTDVEVEREDLEAAKEAKYREIRDAELDHRMGKLSREDWRAIDRGLRAEAIELLRALDRLEGREGDEVPAAVSPEPVSR